MPTGVQHVFGKNERSKNLTNLTTNKREWTQIRSSPWFGRSVSPLVKRMELRHKLYNDRTVRFGLERARGVLFSCRNIDTEFLNHRPHDLQQCHCFGSQHHRSLLQT